MLYKNQVTQGQNMDHILESLQKAHFKDAHNDAEWREAESIRAFMPLQKQSQIIALCVIPLVFTILYDSVYLPGLIAWTIFSLLLTCYRWWISKEYMEHVFAAGNAEQLMFRKRHAWTWPLSAFTWSLLDSLFFSQTSMDNQLICWVILASISVFSATSYSAHIKTMKLFINTVIITLLLGMIWRFSTDSKAAIESKIYIIVPLQFVAWWLITNLGMKLHATYVQSIELVKGNLNLIASLQEQTIRANQAVETKNRFLASAAHDIRQPVLALDVYASMLRSEPEMAGVLTEKIELATKSVIEMFDSLFDLSRLDAGRLNINKSDIDILKMMRELELQHKPAAQSKHLELRMRGDNFKVHTDPQLLKRILGNLLMNAIKFTNKGGVLLACRSTIKGVRFEVWDTGVGIAANEQTAVFGEFYKSSSNLGTSEGFGLGLSIVSRLCEPLGFNFSMQSRLGRGSVFVVEIPTSARQLLKT
jgi:signal transduction histidine kinase